MIRSFLKLFKRRLTPISSLFVLLVAVPAQGQVLYNGQKVVIINDTSPLGGQLFPFGIGVDGAGHLFVADELSNNIFKYSPNGPFATATSYNSSYTNFNCTTYFYCYGIYVDTGGDVFYSDYQGSYTMVDGAPVANFSWPYAVTADPQNQNIFAADQIDGSIIQVPQPWGQLVVNGDGEYVTNQNTIISTGYYPTGIAADAADTVYYAAGGNVYEATQSSGYNPVVIASNIPNNGGLIIDSTGTLYVTNTNGQLDRLSLVNGTWVQSVVAGGFNHPGGVAEDSAGNLYVADSNNLEVDKFFRGAVTFASANVGANSSVSLPFSVLNGTTIGSISIVTGGVANLDFQDAGASTCTAKAYTSTTNCSVNIKFAPTAAGTRAGELIIADASGNRLFSMLLQGLGQAPLPVLQSGVQTLLTSSSLQYPVFGGTVSDPAGNLFVAFSSQNEILEIAPAGASSVLSLSSPTTDPQQPSITAGLSAPSAVAIDNAGSLYIADTGNNRIVVRQPVPGSTTGQYFLYKLPIGSLTLNAPNGVATDAGGNVYIMDNGNSRVIEVNAAGTASVLPNVNIGNQPIYGFTSDPAGNLYLTGNGEVVRFTAATWAAKSIYSGNPQSVAFDAAGDLYISDFEDYGVVVIPPGSNTAHSLPLGEPALYQAPSAISADSAGNLYLTYTYGVYKVARSAASFNFATTIVNQTSTDSPQTLQLENVGNQQLSLYAVSYPTDFPLNSADTSLCASGKPLAPGAQCDISAEFTPTSASALSESITITDNAPVSTQSIALTGTGTAGGQSQTIAIVNRSQQVANICCGTYGSGGPSFYVTSSSSLPVTLTVLTGPMTFSGSLTTVISTTTGSYSFVNGGNRAAGSGIVQATQGGNATYSPAAPVQLTYTVSPANTDIRPTNPPASGTQAYGSSLESLSYRLEGIIAGDHVQLAVTSGVTAGSPVGSYTTNVALTGESAPNYTLTTPTLPYTVTPAPLTVAAVDAYQLTGVAPAPFTYMLSGFQNGDSASVVSGSPGLSTTATASSPAGAYAITPTAGTLSAANYSFSNLISGELNIFAPLNLGAAGAGDQAFLNYSFPAGTVPQAASAQTLTGGATSNTFQISNYQCVPGTPGSCSANLNFAPPAPGLWQGALQLFDNSTPGNLLVSVPIYGTGIGPQVAFAGATPAVYASNISGTNSIALDGAGNLYIAAVGNGLYKVAPGGSPVAFGTGWLKPYSVAVDGAGNVYVADYGLESISMVTPAGVQSTVVSNIVNDVGAIALDPLGNLYYCEGGGSIYKVTPAKVQTLYYQGSSTDSFPLVSSIAFSPTGQMYFADAYNGSIYAVTQGNPATVYSTQVPGAQSIAFDAAGNIYATGAAQGSMGLYELMAAGTVTQLVSETDHTLPSSLALDPSGNAYIANTGQAPTYPGAILKLDRADAPSLIFPTATATGTIDTTDGPRTVSVSNIGNQPLALSAPSSGTNPSYPANFPVNASDSNLCTSSASLAAGSSCDVSANFEPTTTGANTGSIVLTDNQINASNATQSIAVSGTGSALNSPATMTMPVPSSTLTAASATFTWTAGTGVTAYLIHAGSTGVGSTNIYSSGTLHTTTATISGIPTTGGTLNVRLYSYIGSAWQYNDYTYTEASVALPAVIVAPAPSTTLTGSSATFTWTAGSEVTEYLVHVGTTGAGSSNIYNSGGLHAVSATVSGIPTNGAPLNVRLYSYISNAWQYNDYTYTEYGTPTPAVMSTPAPGSALTGSSASFTWTTGIGVTAYLVHVGTTGAGSSNIYSSATLHATSINISGIPTNATPLNVRLYSYINNAWQYNDYTYTEYGMPVPAVIITPAPSSTLTGSSATFTWTTGTGVTAYLVHVGTTGAGSSNIFSSATLHATSTTIGGIPVTGGTLNVRLYSYINAAWQFNDYTYTEQ